MSMNNKTLAAALIAMADDEDSDLDTAQRAVLVASAKLLDMSMFKILHEGYRSGFFDAIQRGTRGTNIHVTAHANANAYALAVLKGMRKMD